MSATRNGGHAPKGLQNFLEPFYTFIRDEVAKPNIGPKYEKYMPYLLSAFFFILGLNLIGQLPLFPGGANVTGNISITVVLALLTFVFAVIPGTRGLGVTAAAGLLVALAAVLFALPPLLAVCGCRRRTRRSTGTS